jgi:hypothetical protein
MPSEQTPNATEAPPRERIMNVRKMVAIDLLIHGKRFILIEFGVGTPFMLALGAFILWSARTQPGAPFTGAGWFGLYILSLACNYAPLLIYAIGFVRRGDARAAVAYEADHMATYAPRYGMQQALLFVPLLVLALALWQAGRARLARA